MSYGIRVTPVRLQHTAAISSDHVDIDSAYMPVEYWVIQEGATERHGPYRKLETAEAIMKLCVSRARSASAVIPAE